MKIIEEKTNQEFTTIEVPAGSSFVCFSKEGEMEALMSEDDDEGGIINNGAHEMVLATIALKDKEIRKIIEDKLEKAMKSGNDK